MKKTCKNSLIPVIPILIMALLAAGCSREAKTILMPPVTGTLPSEDTGTLYPMIQKVYPGALQSLDIPQSYPSDVSPEYPGMTAVFSHVMENDNGEMSSAIELIDITTGLQVPVNISPALSSSKYFTITPVSGQLDQHTQYEIRIYKYAAADTTYETVSVSRAGNRAVIATALSHGLTDNELVTITGFTGGNAGFNTENSSVKVINSTSFSYGNTGADQALTADNSGRISIFSRTLVFDNLVTPPAITISPADPVYVRYKFATGSFSSSDITPPSVAYTNIADGAININPDPAAGDGYIEIIFYDNKIPMIDPSTVNDLSLTLHDITNGNPVSGQILCIFTDTDFKTFRFYPFPNTYLLPSTEYRLSISIDPYFVTDFAGNRVTRRDIYFSTGL